MAHMKNWFFLTSGISEGVKRPVEERSSSQKFDVLQLDSFRTSSSQYKTDSSLFRASVCAQFCHDGNT